MKITQILPLISFMFLLMANNFLMTSSILTTRVTVRNDIRDERINIHCYSSEDDLGVHWLSYGTNFTWHFHVNFWGTTKFYCDFNTTKHGFGNYGVYTPNLRREECSTHCLWSVQENGPCVKENDSKKKPWCQNWKNSTRRNLLLGFSPSPTLLPSFDDGEEADD
ncbi:hypothetical protein ABFX02_06G094100 [Erythranthe guttata]|uniref:uncharacterized protein LOC105977818 n=1 Tax=Erythranthe guttata TaxID=4155 RepID=UPI00064E038F|nr:PREDICTED: uncharacterized protein LOC105977818 [Erythranthe guttata]|eukprot:XP_012858653.1 PREDICTED: uncharacterized protein LOC105977818 [Erythranthe guttata]